MSIMSLVVDIQIWGYSKDYSHHIMNYIGVYFQRGSK